MSRSRKKSTYVTDNHGHNIRRKFMKKYSNKSLRNRLKNNDEVLQGMSYKKHFESYDICDYRWYWTESQAINDYIDRVNGDTTGWFVRRYPTLRSWLKYYRKCVVYK